MDFKNPILHAKAKETIVWTFLWSLWIFLLYFQAPRLPFNNYIDDSWRFALSWLNGSSQTLGIHTFFTYGPLSEWLGYSIPDRPDFCIGGFLVQIFFFASLVHVVFRLTERIQAQPTVMRWSFYFLISISLFWANLQRTDENFYQLWIIGHATLFYSETSSRRRNILLVLWSLGGALLLNYKGSVGFACFALLFTAWIYDAITEKNHWWRPFGHLLLYTLTFEACFKAVSGQWSSSNYLSILFSLSSHYPETHAFNPPDGSCYYFGGLFAVAAFTMAWNYIRLQVSPRFSKIFFLTSVFLWLYFEYKHSFVRADVVHIDWFFKDIFSILPFWAVGQRNHERHAVTLPILFLMLALMSFNSTQRLLGAKTFGGLFKARLQEVKSLHFNTFLSNRHKPQELADDKPNQDLYQNLFQFMHREAATLPSSQRPTLSFVSNRVMLLRYLPDFEARFAPSLLQYISAGCPDLQRADKAFLLDPSCPDYLLLDTPTIDDRCPLFDQSHILAPILKNYENIAYVDHFAVLKRKNNGPQNAKWVIPFLCTPPPSWNFRLTHSILNFVFKTAILKIHVSMLDPKTRKISISNSRVTLIDLQNGVFLGPDTFPQNFPPPPGPPQNPVKILNIQAYWTGWGSWFMKPWAHLPIEVKYIDPRDIPIKR